jgi:EmrB/QacA subfamily drug resistance transporter
LFLIGVACFGLGSLAAGLAPAVAVLLAGRALQGLGPALLIPGSLTIIRAVFDDEKRRAVAIGLWSTSSGLALAVGPALGGLLAARLGWRWVFLFNVPLAAVLLALTAMFVPRLPRSAPRHRFDLAGAALTIAAVGALAFATIEGQARGWAFSLTLGSFAAGGAVLAAFVTREHRSRAGLVDISLFARASFSAANVAAFVVFFAFVGAIVYFSAYFQQVQGRSAIAAGLAVSAIGVAFALAASQSGRLVSRLGPRWPMVGGLVLAAAATLGLLRLGRDTGISAIWWNFALLGAGIGACLTPMTVVSMSAVDASRAGMVSAVHNSLRQVGQVFGVAVLGALVYARLPGGSAGQLLGPAAGARFLTGLHHALLVSGSALFAAAAVAALLTRPRPSALPGSRGRAGRRCSRPSAVPPGPSSWSSSRSRPGPAATRIPATPARNTGSGPDCRRS